MNDLDRLKEMAGINEAENVPYVVVNDPALFADGKLPMDGQTPIYMVRDSDLNGVLASTTPITSEMIQRAISTHSNWR